MEEFDAQDAAPLAATGSGEAEDLVGTAPSDDGTAAAAASVEEETGSGAGEDPFGAVEGDAGTTGSADGGGGDLGGLDLPEPEPEETPLDDFNREWQAQLDAKRMEEQQAQQDACAQSQEAVEKFMQERETMKASRMNKNREEEQQMQEKIEEEGDEGNVWERVTDLCSDRETKEGDEASDTSRMRSLLIQLKTDPPRGAVAAN